MKFINNKKSYKDTIFLSLIFIILAVFIVYFAKDVGIGWDEGDNRDLGIYSYNYYRTLGQDRYYFTAFAFDEVFMTRGPVIETIRETITRKFNLPVGMSFYHIFIGLTSLFAFFFAYKVGANITKSHNFGIFAILILLTTPRFIGDIYNNSKDIAPIYLLLGIMFFSINCIYKQKKLNYLVLGILTGLIISMRVVFLYVYAVFVVHDFVILISNKKRNWHKFAINHLTLLLSWSISLHIVQPYLHIKPVIGLIDMIRASTQFPLKFQVLFEGVIYKSNELPWYYLLKNIIITTPLFHLFLLFLGIVSAILIINDQRNFKKKIIHVYILSLFILPLFLVILTRPAMYDGWRHFYFMIAPMTILMILGFQAISVYLSRFKIKYLLFIVLVVCLLPTVITLIQLHPYQYVFYNSLVGGLSGAYKHYETDYWGKSFRESVLWLRSDQVANTKKQINIKSCGHPLSSYYYFSKNMHLVTNINKADYYICYTRFNEDKLAPKNYKMVHKVSRLDVPLNYVFKRQ